MSTVLAARNVVKSFAPVSGSAIGSVSGSPVEILRDINFSLERGQSMAITGRSGSGKSTLLSVLAGLEGMDRGSVSVLNQDWSALAEPQRSAFRGRHVGFVFQSFYLLPHLTASENILLPLQISARAAGGSATDAVNGWLESVGLIERRHHLPHQLSGGEQQRVAIARALIHRPELVFLDEPTGNLDEETGQKIFQLLLSLRGQTSFVLVTHDLELARKANRHYVLRTGILHEATR